MNETQLTAPLNGARAVPAATVRAAADLMTELGIGHVGDGLAETPARFAAALIELTAGLRQPDPAAHLLRTFEPGGPHPSMICAAGIEFVSVCEHHLLPFYGLAAVAYLPAPGARVAGVSKLARLVTGYAARPQMQERLGRQIADAITTHLDTQGAGCSDHRHPHLHDPKGRPGRAECPHGNQPPHRPVPQRAPRPRRVPHPGPARPMTRGPHPIPAWWHDDPAYRDWLTATYGSLQRAADRLHTQPETPPGWTYLGATGPAGVTISGGSPLTPGHLWIAPGTPPPDPPEDPPGAPPDQP